MAQWFGSAYLRRLFYDAISLDWHSDSFEFRRWLALDAWPQEQRLAAREKKRDASVVILRDVGNRLSLRKGFDMLVIWVSHKKELNHTLDRTRLRAGHLIVRTDPVRTFQML